MGLVEHQVAAFLLFLLTGVGAGQRVVTIQKGPLYRVLGSHVTLWCKVSGYQGPAEQTFQWSIYLPSASEREVQIVSTADPSFPYAIYTQRVRAQEIYVERVQGDAVLLHITELQDRDAGEYECHTPNTDERYFGSYSAKTNLTVIADTLSVSMGPKNLTHAEGDAMELTCLVSRSTAQHTHLSVGWYCLRGEHRAEILTLSKDFVVMPGPAYAQRFLAGNVRLDKVGSTSYKLSIVAVEPSDQGQLYCEAAEWIEDPDGMWKDISRKQSERTSLVVTPQDQDLCVNITATKNDLSEGDTLWLSCKLEAQRSDSRHFQVAWVLNSAEVARIDPRGLLIWKKEYEERASLGQLHAFKQSNTIYILTIREVGLEDSGAYHCSVLEVNAPGSLQSIQTNLSSVLRISVKPIGLGLRATLRSRTATVSYTQSFELICHVSASCPVEELLLSVGWLFQPKPPTDGYQELVRVLPDGTVSWGPAQPRFQGRAQLMKAGAFSRLHIHSAMAGHAGTYQCEVGVWRTLQGQRAVSFISNPLGIKVVPPESLLQVATRESSVEVAGGADASIECRMEFPLNNSQLAISWYYIPPPPADATPVQIVRASHTGLLEYGAGFSSPTQKSRFLSQRVSSHVFQLRILSASPGDQGQYCCAVEEWRWLEGGWYSLGERWSGRTRLLLRLPESELHLEKANSSILARHGQEVTLGCLLKSTLPPAARLSAAWFHGKEDGHERPLLTLNHDGAIEFLQEGQVGRLQLRRPTAGDLSLTLGSVQEDDAGTYHCRVEEWQQRGNKDKWELQTWALSGYTQLTTTPPEITVASRICSSPSLLNFILCLPLVLILLLALAGFCWCFISRKRKKGTMRGNQLMELQGAEEIKQT
ncbi:immunoglobulin superfamily member 3-like [Centrocercus urophasianus]|uniref:immunoglobulin superfamily member 3-like n=1 Tax=Centrocercus urophasianus TaxID=9002 RepID=UPI001C651201|nr:immunoglobulin superfamily member 3-like [Centrocercus urophasianus]